MLRLIIVLLACAASAHADPLSIYSFPVLGGSNNVQGVVPMGLDANSRAWPCGSPQVAFGCGSGTTPLAATSTVTSGTVATANTFQLAAPANAARKGCLVVNKSTAPMMVYLGLPSAATPATSVMLAPGTTTMDGGRLNCAVGSGIVISDALSITSTTAGAAYLVIWQ